MYRWVIVLVLSVASATAWAQSVDTTTRAWNAAVAAERQVTQLATQRNALARRWQDELQTVDRLKKSRSWRRDRELRDALSEANELGKQLETANAELATAQRRLATARRDVIAAIDAELAASPTTPRRAQLERARVQVAPQRKVHRIVLPDMQIDPYADPEELDQHAVALRESEIELQNQIKGLEAQATELERVDQLRKAHDRTREMDVRDNNDSRRNTTSDKSRGAAEPFADQNSPEGRPGETTGVPPPAFEMDASITLAEVVDPSTIDSLNRAQRSGDPKERAAAAKRARDAVARKLQQLRTTRKQVEDRAKQLRGGR
jgi:hypothetical protein